MSSLVPVPLEPDSLYIATSQIFGELGKFHWVLYFTGASGAGATRYQWSPNVRGDTAEFTECDTIDTPTTFTRTGTTIFAFVKIHGYIPISLNDLAPLCANVFDPADRYSTVYENRRNNMTCRTWLLAALY
ncbi:hypothetical protein BDP27DRAFT_1418205 [Rhodocollybia butyracea]|uniref:Uncharacterized protein n=1 Tax=Rhodocollybia butyracea TaxID=206335 RepID=A0A9P5Q009_9AGAR|nr:hypothetical protein BDP27DRAFT_1418205 [Rhodocollybia butyracea]